MNNPADGSSAATDEPVEDRATAPTDWLLRQKVTLPDPVEGFVERTALDERCNPLKWRVTTINAPGGFGKTTLLVEACRRLRERGILVAWLAIDEDDTPKTLATYLSFAFSVAGLDVVDFEAATPAAGSEGDDYGINLLLNSIDVFGADCVLALDDVHRLRDKSAAAVVNRLLQHAPGNLHLALSLRHIPAGLDIATPVFEGRGVTISTDELRFDKPQIARFFDATLSRTELAELSEFSQGWPIALRIHRNVRERSAPAGLAHDIASNWIETHLWRGLSKDDQDFVLDIGLFEWIDAELVDEVLGAGAVRRVRSIPALYGLLRSAGDSATLHLHPLVRQYCTDRRFRETPDRYRSVHRATAGALARQGQVISGMRHASEAGDPKLVGEILDNAGGFRLWFEHGLTRLRQANELITDAVVAASPRAGLVRCMELTMTGEIERAVATYVDVGARTDGFTRGSDDRGNRELANDHLAFRYVLWNCGCRPIDTPEARYLADELTAHSQDPAVDPLMRGAAQFALCEIENHRADFDAALDRARCAYELLGRRSWYLTMFIDLQTGNIAMAQGRVADADEAYARARRTAKAELMENEGPMVLADVLITELRLERNKPAPLSRRWHKVPQLARSGSGLDIYAAASEAAIELAAKDSGVSGALEELEEIVAFAQRTGLATLYRCLLALRVSLLAAVNRTDEAQRAWDSAEFPVSRDDMVDLDNQTWREMEAISCAGLRLGIARRRFDAARELAEALLAAARGRGLRRTEMRGLALAIVLEHRAGDSQRARKHLIAYLEAYAETDYARPLNNHPVVAFDVLSSLDREDVGERLGGLAESLLGELSNTLKESKRDDVPELTPRETEILEHLEAWRDKEIADALRLSEDGVRYHNKKIFRKLGVRSRLEAIRRARSLGILPAPPDQTRTR